MVVGPQQEEVSAGVPVVAADVPHRHLVQRRRDGADAVLGQHLAQKPLELVCGDGLLAQQLHELIQRLTEDLPELGALLRPPQKARLGKARPLLLQGLL